MAALETFNRKFFGGLQRRARSTANSVRFAFPVYPLLELTDMVCRTAPYTKFVSEILAKLPQWREERLPPPRVNQSEVTHQPSHLF